MMNAGKMYDDLETLLKSSGIALQKGPIAVIFAEDDVEVGSTIKHHIQCGFQTIIVLAAPIVRLPEDLPTNVLVAPNSPHRDDAVSTPLNKIIASVPEGTWMYYCYNAEYLFFPFSEHRTIGEMLTFHTEERRDAMLAYVIDLYADDLGTFPNAVSIEHAHLDQAGYFALARGGEHGPKERQLDFYGGLRWRFEEHVPKNKRRIDRIAIFRTKRNLQIRNDHTFDDEEYNTYSCPWHHNLTAAICSFRTAKALKLNPGSSPEIDTFRWYNSVPFEWKSRQLMDLGLIEPGQWF